MKKKEERIGETRRMKNGLLFSITAYRNCLDMDGVFENGVIREHVSYANFKKGYISLEKKKQDLSEERKGETRRMKNGKMATISFYGGYKCIRVTFEDGRETHTSYDVFKKGAVRYPDITPASVKKLLNVYKDTKDGRRIALTDFNGYNDVTVKYEDGEALEHIRFKDYRKSLAKN